MVTMVDPPGGWAYGFPAPLQGNYEKQLRDAGYPEADIPLALEYSWYHTQPEDGTKTYVPVYTACTGTASDGDDGA